MKIFFEMVSIIVSFVGGIVSIFSLFVEIINSRINNVNNTIYERYKIIFESYKRILDIIFEPLENTFNKIFTKKSINYQSIWRKEIENINSFLEKSTKEIVNQKRKDKRIKEQDSIIEELLNKKKKTYNNAIKLIFIAALIYCIINIIFDRNIKMEIIMFLYIFVVLIIISQLLIRYRIKKGYFGTNYEEAREIFIYLMENNNKGDKNSGKKIFNEIDKNKAKDIVPVPEPAPDGGI